MNKETKISERYHRQVLLREWGEEGQRKLLQAKVLVVGAGGLGCPALLYLAAAGVGTIGIVDPDTVSLTNLHRQVIYTTKDVGQPKTEVAARRLGEMNPDVELHTYTCRLDNKNALRILKEYDLVLDATDNMASRYLISDACALLHKPLIYGGISRFEGQIAVLNCWTTGTPPVSYRDLFPQPPLPESLQTCDQSGVLGVLPGMIGTMQATEVLKLITGIGTPLVNQLFTYNALTNNSYQFTISPRSAETNFTPKNEADLMHMDYETFCHLRTSSAEEIDTLTFQSLLLKNDLIVIDVRERDELPEVHEFSHRKVPLSELQANSTTIESSTVVLFCQSGTRGQKAAKMLREALGENTKIYNLKGGILQWKREQG